MLLWYTPACQSSTFLLGKKTNLFFLQLTGELSIVSVEEKNKVAQNTPWRTQLNGNKNKQFEILKVFLTINLVEDLLDLLLAPITVDVHF